MLEALLWSRPPQLGVGHEEIGEGDEDRGEGGSVFWYPLSAAAYNT